jgi:hypothetical protein
MKTLFWNIRGIANTPSRVALKRLILSNQHDFIFLAEPWLSYDRFPQNWLRRLGLKLFACNSRHNNIPNLWCICSFDINPNIINTSDQHVSFTFTQNSLTFGVNVVYASTCYIHRRRLWNALSWSHNQYHIPWCSTRDFNAIIGAHEHRGATSPPTLPMIEFLEWSNTDNLIHLPTRGMQFTWANGRQGRRCTKKKTRQGFVQSQSHCLFFHHC